MGRELKRVPLDFDWPLNKVWEGYVNPYYEGTDCRHCETSGYSPEALRLKNLWYGYIDFAPSYTGSRAWEPLDDLVYAFATRNIGNFANESESIRFYGTSVKAAAILLEANRLCGIWNRQWSHHLDQDDVNALWAEDRLTDLNPRWRENHGNAGIPAPTAAAVNAWSISGGMGHDSINSWICIREKAKRLGVPLHCAYCDGESVTWESKAAKALYDAWTEIEPPTGEGWQVWETVTEGSPISPVFANSEALVAWLVEEGYSIGAAQAFAAQGWIPSMIRTSGGELYNDIESADK